MTTGERPREATLGAIRIALGVTGTERSRRQAVAKRLRTHPVSLIPERARATGHARFDLFIRMLQGQGATVSRIEGPQAIPEAVATYLRENNLPAAFRCGPDDLLAAAPWERTPWLTRRMGPGGPHDEVTISHAAAAAAETGTLFLLSGLANPTTLNFLPETHIVVIGDTDILGSYEDAWNRIRAIYGEKAMPRTVNLISGPSRTADIEQIIVMGAHGPRRLHVIVVA